MNTTESLSTPEILNDDPLGEHLLNALKHAQDVEAVYHIRSALQHRVIELENDHVRGPRPVDSEIITGP